MSMNRHEWLIAGMVGVFVVGCILYNTSCGSKIKNHLSPNQQIVEKTVKELASDPVVKEEVAERAAEKLHKDPEVREKSSTKAAVLLHKDPEVRHASAVKTAEVLQKDPEFRTEAAKENVDLLEIKKEMEETQRFIKRQGADIAARDAQIAQLTRELGSRQAAAEPMPSSDTSGGHKLTGGTTGGGGTSVSQPAPVASFSTQAEEIGPCPDKFRACWAGVLPYRDGGDAVIPELPAGATLVDVEMYDDVRGVKPYFIGPKHRFPRPPGSGFNFKWRDREGNVHYQMITMAQRRMLQARGLDVDDSYQGKCKYVMPIE